MEANRILKILSFLFVYSGLLGQSVDYKTLKVKKGNAKIELIESRESGLKGFLTTETNYSIKYLTINNVQGDFLVEQKTVTKKWFDVEGQERTIFTQIYAPNDLKNVLSTFEQICDEIIFHLNYYVTIKRGCCAQEPIIRIFNYDNRQLIEGESLVNIITIPNNDLILYTALRINKKESFGVNDTIGSIYFLSNFSDLYEIILINKNRETSFLGSQNPALHINYQGNRITPQFQPNELANYYLIWGLKEVKSMGKINELEILWNVEYYTKSMQETRSKTIRIPILNGLPFGKNELKQVLNL